MIMEYIYSDFSFFAGSIIAALLSWKRNKDVAWSIIAFLLGWIYVLYWYLTEIE